MLLGFCSVRYSFQPLSVLPSANDQVVAGAFAPKASWPSRIAPDPKLKFST